MAPPIAPIVLFVFSFVVLLIGIVLVAVAEGAARDIAMETETTLIASRSRYILGQVGGSVLCGTDADGCDGACNPIDLSSSVPTYAYFQFYNITNPDAVAAGIDQPALDEVGPFTCVTPPPVMTARITRASSTASTDSSAETMAYTETLECDAVQGGGDALVYLFDKQNGVQARTVSSWVQVLKGQILSGGDTVGTGGAPEFASYASHGNTSVLNNYMRRTSDDAIVLPFFPHAHLADGDFLLTPQITTETTLQWHISSIGQTVSFTWKHGLYVIDPVLEVYSYARFATSLPVSDLSSRNSDLFDRAYSYHKCGSVGDVTFDDVANYPPCEAPTSMHKWSLRDQLGDASFNLDPLLVQGDEIPRSADALSPDDYFVDVNLYVGIPSAILDANGAGGFQAYEFTHVPEFASVVASDPNCTGTFGDPNVAAFLWAWGWWSGSYPYVSHTELGYSPTVETGQQGKWLAEFGVTRNGAVLPAFAFSMMPKLVPLIAPHGLGSSYPLKIMGAEVDANAHVAGAATLPDRVGSTASGQFMHGSGIMYFILCYTNGWYTFYKYTGIYLILWSLLITLPTGVVRMKLDAAN